MDQRFSAFFLEKYRLALQQEAWSLYENEISSEKVRRPNKLGRLISHIVARIIAFSQMLQKKDSSLENPKRITNQSYIE